jgi:hypothetical protein
MRSHRELGSKGQRGRQGGTKANGTYTRAAQVTRAGLDFVLSPAIRRRMNLQELLMLGIA